MAGARCRARYGLQLGVSLLAVALTAGQLQAVCPTDVCDCLGQAGHFAVVAGDLSTKAGRIIEDGYGYAVGPTVEASVCAKTGKLSGKVGGETSVSEDVVLTATSGVAAALKGYIDYGYVYPGVLIDGNLLTGGGQITGGEYAEILGTTDTTGLDPGVADCRQALSDAATASATL